MKLQVTEEVIVQATLERSFQETSTVSTSGVSSNSTIGPNVVIDTDAPDDTALLPHVILL